MNLNEAELITPVFTGTDDENMIALSTWQSLLYSVQNLATLSNSENRQAIVAQAIAILGTILDQSIVVQPGYAQTVATPLVPVTQPDQKDAVDHDFTLENRMLELAGVRTRGVVHG